MASEKRIQVRLRVDATLHRALKRQARRAGQTASQVMNDALKLGLEREERFGALVRESRRQKGRPYEEFEAELKRDGLL